MEKRKSPKGFIVVLPGEIIEIPQDSDKAWLTLFYSLPRELAEKWKPAYDLPRCPYEVLRTDKYDHIVCDDMFKLLVWDCYAWSAWQFFQVKDRKGNYRDIPGAWTQYAGYFPLWRLSYSIIPYIRMKFEQNGLGFQNLYNIPQGVEVPWLTYQQFSNLVGNVTDIVVAEQEWQPVIDAIWENRTVEDYETTSSTVKTDFMRKWHHNRSGKPISLDEMTESEDGDIFDVADPRSDFENSVISEMQIASFAESTIMEKDREILKLRMEGYTEQEIADKVGYLKDPADKTKWIVDEAAAMVVRRIFMLCMEGRGPMQIAKLLQEEKVLNPTAYKRQIGIKTPSPETADPYHWNTNTVVHILERREYTGCTVNFKTYTNSIWDKKQRETPLDKQAIFFNTHPAIIEQEVFDKVQEIRQQRHRRTKTGKNSLFSGIVYCADCGAKMRYCTTNYFEKRQDHFVCANYRSNTGSCSAHFIRAVVLEDLVWMHMKAVIFYVTRYEKHFRAVMEHKLLLSSEEKICASIKRLEQAQRRMGELDRLFIRIYEDNVAGRINDERFSMMSRSYETEQEQLKVEIQTLQQDIEIQERQIENLEQFIQRVQKYKDLDELTPYALRELVKGVYIEAPDKSSGKRRQNIRISYDLVGFIPLNELMKEETA